MVIWYYQYASFSPACLDSQAEYKAVNCTIALIYCAKSKILTVN